MASKNKEKEEYEVSLALILVKNPLFQWLDPNFCAFLL